MQRRAQLPLQLCNKAPAGGLGSLCRALAAHQHNGRGKGIGAGCNGTVCHFGAHGPCAGNGKACPDDGTEHGLPAGGGSFGILVCVALLVGVVDGYRNVLTGVLVNLLAGVQHSVLKEIPSFFGAALKAVGGRHQFFCLGHQHGAEQLGVGVFQRLPHPDIEEIGQVCIADVVIIGRVRGNHNVPQAAVALCVKLTNFCIPLCWKLFYAANDPIQHIFITAGRGTKRICFCKIPNHGNCLTTEGVSHFFAGVMPRTNGGVVICHFVDDKC